MVLLRRARRPCGAFRTSVREELPAANTGEVQVAFMRHCGTGAARRPTSVCLGSTPMNTTSLLSTTSWFPDAIVTLSGNSAASAAALTAPRGDRTMQAGSPGRVHMPRTIAEDMVPTPTKPYRVVSAAMALLSRSRPRNAVVMREGSIFTTT